MAAQVHKEMGLFDNNNNYNDCNYFNTDSGNLGWIIESVVTPQCCPLKTTIVIIQKERQKSFIHRGGFLCNTRENFWKVLIF